MASCWLQQAELAGRAATRRVSSEQQLVATSMRLYAVPAVADECSDQHSIAMLQPRIGLSEV